MASHFVPRFTADDLPRPGAPDAVEGQVLDCKEWHHDWQPPKSVEMAKDIAAFANASGRVGTHDRVRRDREQREPARALRGQGRRSAAALCAEVNKIVERRLKPPPTIVPRVIDIDGTHVIAINVYPSPGQAVGVRVLHTEQAAVTVECDRGCALSVPPCSMKLPRSSRRFRYAATFSNFSLMNFNSNSIGLT